MGHGGGGASCSMFTKDTYSNTHQDGGGEKEVQARGAMDMERGRSHIVIRNHSHMITYEVGPTTQSQSHDHIQGRTHVRNHSHSHRITYDHVICCHANILNIHSHIS